MEYVKISGMLSGFRTYKQALELYKDKKDVYCDQNFEFVRLADLPEAYRGYMNPTLLNENSIYVGFGKIEYSGGEAIEYAALAKKYNNKYAVLYYNNEMVGINFMQDGETFLNSIDTIVVTNDENNTFMTQNSYLGNMSFENKLTFDYDDEILNAAEKYIEFKQQENSLRDFAEYIMTKEYDKYLKDSVDYYAKNLTDKKFSIYVSEQDNGILFKIPLYSILINMYVNYNQSKEKIISEGGENAFTKEVATGIVDSSLDKIIKDLDNEIFEQCEKHLSKDEKELIINYLKDCYEIGEDNSGKEKGYYYDFDDQNINWGRSLFHFLSGNLALRSIVYEDLEKLFIYGLEEDFGPDYKQMVLDSIYNFENKLEEINSSLDYEELEKREISSFMTEMNCIWNKAGLTGDSEETMISIVAEHVAMFRSLKECNHMDNDELYLKLQDYIKIVNNEELVGIHEEFMN